MSYQGPIDFTKNPFAARAVKFLLAAAFALVEIANVWLNGPDWVYAAAAVVAAVLVYVAPNAPKYADPRANARGAIPTTPFGSRS